MSASYITANGTNGAMCGTVPTLGPHISCAGDLHSCAADDLPRGSKFSPEPLIYEGARGEVCFAPMASMASELSREQARLFYEEGLKETRLVSAMRWRDVETQHSPTEIANAEEMVEARAGVLRKEERLARILRREQHRTSPDPFELDRIERELSEVRSYGESMRAKIAAASERELSLVTLLELTAKLDRRAKGWKLKAQRQVACGLYGKLYKAEKCGRSYYRRFRCRNRYCPVCGPHTHDVLAGKYLRLESCVKDFLKTHPSYSLKILDITAIKRGERMPSADDVRKFKADIKKLIQHVNRHIADKLGLPLSKQLTGYLYCLEFGFENNNLHCHGILLSPYIEQAWLSQAWREIRADGSFRVFIAEATSFKTAVQHALEYTGKYAASSAERAFELELAFAGCRRVDGLGWFFNRLPKEDDACDLSCPCGDSDCFLKPDLETGWVPVTFFEQKGIRDLDEVRERGSPASRKGAAH